MTAPPPFRAGCRPRAFPLKLDGFWQRGQSPSGSVDSGTPLFFCSELFARLTHGALQAIKENALHLIASVFVALRKCVVTVAVLLPNGAVAPVHDKFYAFALRCGAPTSIPRPACHGWKTCADCPRARPPNPNLMAPHEPVS